MPDAPERPGAHVELKDIGKSFGGVRALAGVSLSIARGSIHALVGENGAGKSTLAGPLAGELGFALLSKDRIKETLHDGLGAPEADLAWSRFGSADLVCANAGVVPAGRRTLPHRHLSTGLTLVTRAEPGCATLLGTEVDAEGRIRHPVQIDWEPGGVLVTPPGLWHAHVNESMEPARLVSIADAGVHDEGLGGMGEFDVRPPPTGGPGAS